MQGLHLLRFILQDGLDLLQLLIRGHGLPLGVTPLATALFLPHLRVQRGTARQHRQDHGCVRKISLHCPTLLDTRCMMAAATYAVAAVNGAFDANIVIQRLPSLRKMRATSPSLPIECQSDYVR